MKISRSFALLAYLAVATLAGLVDAQEEQIGIATTGVGQVWARPNLVEFQSVLEGSSELGGDAFTKYKQYKERTETMLKDLAVDKLQLKLSGIRLGWGGDGDSEEMMMMRPGRGRFARGGGEDGAGVQPQTSIASSARITIGGIDKLSEEEVVEMTAKLLDRFRDGGLTIFPTAQNRYNGGQLAGSMATFIVEDVAALRVKARKQAFDRAKQEAEELAALANVKLGRVLGVSEYGESSQRYPYSGGFGDYDEDDGEDEIDDDAADGGDAAGNADAADGAEKKVSVRSGTCRPVPVRVRVWVRFAIEP